MQRPSGDEIDGSTEQLGQLVLEAIQGESELGAVASNIEEIDVTVGRFLTSTDRAEQRQLHDAELVADLGEAVPIDLMAAHDEAVDATHGPILPDHHDHATATDSPLPQFDWVPRFSRLCASAGWTGHRKCCAIDGAQPLRHRLFT